MRDRPAAGAPTASERMDSAVIARQKEVAETLERITPEIVRVAGWVERYGRLGYGPHVATRDSNLTREIKDWIAKGCPDA